MGGQVDVAALGRCPRRHEILVGDPVAAGDPRGDHDRLRRGEALYDWYKAQRTLGAVWVAITLCALVLQFFLASYLGDAARYLSPRPRNIQLRQKIRTEGIKLLRNLHKSGEYDRIVLVGHSLGSVIGYDIVTHLWEEFNEKLPGMGEPEQQRYIREQMDRNDTPQPVIRNLLARAGEDLDSHPDRRGEFRDLQREAWREIRRFDNPWLITDFITLGSPLTHGILLLASSREDFESRKEQRELVTCPPRRDAKGYAYSAPVPLDVGEGKKYTPLILHHAAPFAVTRWTNLYFPSQFGVFGDVVGGPLAPDFGPGILDIAVRTTRWRGLANWCLGSHGCYWRLEDLKRPEGKNAGKNGEDSRRRTVAIDVLKEVIELAWSP